MKRRLFALVIAAAMLTGTAVGSTASEVNNHDCAGTVSAALAQALGPGFGAAVSTAAQAQAVDNFGLANCGDTSGQNP